MFIRERNGVTLRVWVARASRVLPGMLWRALKVSSAIPDLSNSPKPFAIISSCYVLAPVKGGWPTSSTVCVSIPSRWLLSRSEKKQA